MIPYPSSEALQVLGSNRVVEITILLTHEHPDHTSGVNFFREKYKSQLVCNKKCAEKVLDKRNNSPLVILMKLREEDIKNGTNLVGRYREKNPPYICIADITFEKQMKLKWSGRNIVLTATPGHSPGSMTIEYDRKLLFTGDYLIKDTQVITRFKDSCISDLNNITVPYFKGIDQNLVILPGHGDVYVYKDSDIDPLEWLCV